MRRFFTALLVPVIIMLLLNWQLIMSLVRAEFVLNDHKIDRALSEESLPDNSLTIPRLALSAPLIISSTDPTLVTDWKILKTDLTQGVSLSSKVPQPGQPGTTVILGHSSDWSSHPYAAIFAPLNQLEAGDTVRVKQNGKLFEYQVTKKVVVSPTDLTFFRQTLQSDMTRNHIALITCWPLFTTAKRLVVVGDLINQ